MEDANTSSSTVPTDFVPPYEQHIKRFPGPGQEPFPGRPFLLLVDGKDLIRNAPPIEPFLSHPLIQEILVINDLPHLEALITAWHSTLSPTPGPPGYEIYALESVFYHAIQTSHADIVEYFLNHGIRMCKLATWQAASCRSSREVWRVFLARGWDINDCRDTYTGALRYGFSILREGDNEELITWFLKNGADPNAQVGGGMWGVTNFMFACRQNSLVIIRLRYAHNAYLTSGILPYAISRPKPLPIITFLLDIGASIDATEFSHDPKAASAILNRGSALNLACGRTGEEWEEAVAFMLEKGASTDVKNFKGVTCLEIAKNYGTEKMVELIESARSNS